MSLATLPRTGRMAARVLVIGRVLSKHGFGHFVDRLQLGGYLPGRPVLRRRKQLEESEAIDPLETVGQRLVKVCEELGPTFIKLGQIASTRPDILPPPLLDALSNLQDQVKPFPASEARRLLETDIGDTIEALFEQFDEEPFASGSIGQAHKGITRDGQPVVVKIRRPGIDKVVKLDVYALKFLAEQAEQFFPELRPYKPRLLIDEFTQTLERELDFINEASATERFHEAFADQDNIITPRVRWDLTGPTVLTLQYLDGMGLRAALKDDTLLLDKPQLAQQLADAFVRQFFELGLFHADPHPGNILIKPPGQLQLVDFGMTGQLDPETLDRVVLGLLAVIKREFEILVDVLDDMNCLGEDTDRFLLMRDLRIFVNKYYGLPLRRMDMSVIFGELLETVRNNDVTLPRDFVAALKALSIISGVVESLDPQLNIVEILKPKLSALLRDRFSASRVLRGAGISAWHLGAILRDGPRTARQLMRGIGRGRFQINIRHENLDYLARELDRSSNRLASAVIMASTIICGTMLLSMETDVMIFNTIPLRFLGLIGYVIASVMAVWIVVAIIRSGRLS